MNNCVYIYSTWIWFFMYFCSIFLKFYTGLLKSNFCCKSNANAFKTPSKWNISHWKPHNSNLKNSVLWIKKKDHKQNKLTIIFSCFRIFYHIVRHKSYAWNTILSNNLSSYFDIAIFFNQGERKWDMLDTYILALQMT